MNLRTEFEPPKPIGVAGRKNAAQHGTRTGYGYGCRCEPCVLANRVWKRAWAGNIPLEEHLAKVKRERQKHGVSAYQRGCRCVVCRTANAEAHKPFNRGYRPIDTPCEGCGRLFRGERGLKIHLGLGCTGPVLERVG